VLDACNGCSQVISSCRAGARNGFRVIQLSTARDAARMQPVLAASPTPVMAVAVLGSYRADACNGFRVGLPALSSTAWLAAGCVASSAAVVLTPVMAVARFSAAASQTPAWFSEEILGSCRAGAWRFLQPRNSLRLASALSSTARAAAREG
jgi:hypothetical protein